MKVKLENIALQIEQGLLQLQDVITSLETGESQTWAFPIGEGEYPPNRWYAASRHTPDGPGYRHVGLDLNLDVSPWGDIERILGLSVFALADGVVTYYTSNWSGVPMIVIMHEHKGKPLWVRYAHITPIVKLGDTIKVGQRLGGFANWTGADGGDHLHLDMATSAYTREWIGNAPFIDPVPILNEHLDPDIVYMMLTRGM